MVVPAKERTRGYFRNASAGIVLGPSLLLKNRLFLKVFEGFILSLRGLKAVSNFI